MQKTLHYQIDSHSGIPVYRQIMDQTKYYVASGALKTGDQLPSIRELSRQLCVNPTTVVKAYTELEHDQVIEMRHGRGVFVTEQSAAMSERDREKVLRRLARQLAVEATQMSASADLVWRVVREQLEALNEESSTAQPAVIAIVSKKAAHG
ncbi:MAG: GntR family transcriptional regulator [Limisphaerales bacterium]